MPGLLNRCCAIIVGLTIAVSMLGATVSPAEAQTASHLVPIPGAWCGVTDDGGSLRLMISDDSRFVEQIDMVDTKGGAFSSTESGCATERAQVKRGVFIFRCRGSNTNDGRSNSPGGPNRCTKAPCRGGGGGASNTSQASLIRGFMISPESMRGNYSAYAVRVRTTVRGTTSSVKRVVGNYIAWPVSSAPCP